MMLKTSGDAMLVRPTTRAEKATLRRRVQAGELVEPFPCMFERADAWEQLLPDQRMRRILSTLGASRPDIVFCSYSAAVMHRLPVSYRLLSRVHVAADAKEASHNSHHIVRHRMARVPSVEVDGVRVTPLVDTVIDCLITVSLGDGLAIADAFLRQLDIERELLVDLVAVLGAARRGVARALYTASWADGRSESGGESIARGVMIEEGIVPADLQVSFTDPVDRESTMRGDYLFRLLDGTQVLGELDGETRWTRSTKKQAGRMTELIGDLMELARADELDSRDSFSDVDVSRIVGRGVEDFLPLAEAFEKHLVTSIDEGAVVKGDETSLTRLVSVLLDNAIKYSDEYGDVEVTLSVTRGSVQFVVSNPASSLTAGETSQLFERFYRPDAARERSAGGYGIGLSIARSIVERHGGEIRARKLGDILEISASLPGA